MSVYNNKEQTPDKEDIVLEYPIPDIKKQKPRLVSIKYFEDYMLVLPYLLIFTLFTIVPVLTSLYFSFTNFNILEPPSWVGINNYFQLILDDSLFIKSLKNTLLLSAITGPLSYFLCLILAWLVNEFHPKVRAGFTLLFYTPSIAGSVFMIWHIILSNDAYGFLNGVLLSLNLIYEPIQWLNDSRYMLGAAIVVILWMSLGTSFLVFIAGYQNIDGALYEAGAVDGVRNRWQELWFITLPSIKPQLMFGAVLSITNSFGIGGVLTGLFGFPTTNYTLHTVVHHLEDYGNIRFEMGYASAVATLLFLIMFGANKFVQKLLRKVGD